MTNIKFLKDRIIIDGHADTKEQCETITLLCDNLAKSKDFKTVRYEKGYAEFEKVGRTVDLKFAAASDNLTWVINEEPTIEPLGLTQNIKIYNANFTSNGTTFENIGLSNEMVPGKPTNLANIIYNAGLSSTESVYNSGMWENEAYRTIKFETAPAGELLQWLQANATQGSSTTKQQIDLSTLSGWANLLYLNHVITVKAKASGYADSAASNAVSVEKVASGHTVNFSNDLGESPSTTGKLEYTLDGTTWNTVLEWSNWDGNQQPLQVTTLSNVSTIKFRLTISAGERSTLTLTGTVVGSTTKVFEIEANNRTTTVSTDLLTLTSAINVSITNA